MPAAGEASAPPDFSPSPFAAEIGRWRVEARKRMLAEAFAWSSACRDGLPAAPEGVTLLLAGHQPEFFHPGVWFKNFLLDREARNGTRPVVPVNVIIDYDLCSKRHVVHPVVDSAGVRLESLGIDRFASPLPHERATIVDRNFLAAFPERLLALRKEYWPASGVPLAEPLFAEGRSLLDAAQTYGGFAATARHRYEALLGLSTLEVPFSRLAEESSFREFVWLLLREAESFRVAYDRALAAVRHVQKLRSRTHPAPDLVASGEWVETPLWVWTASDPRRRRLFVRRASGAEGLEVSDQGGLRESVGEGDDVRAGAERLAELSKRGVVIRPRALAATTWMRMILADRFIHGIGGAKYDQAADLLMSGWFGVEPPPFEIATATFNLTDETPEATSLALAEKRRLLRDLTQHPERHLPENAPSDAHEAARNLAETLRAVAGTGPNADAHRRMAAARGRLREATAERREATIRDVDRLERELRDRRILDSRERSILLFDAEALPRRLSEAAEQAALSGYRAPTERQVGAGRGTSPKA